MKIVLFFLIPLFSACGSTSTIEKKNAGVMRPMMSLDATPSLSAHWKKWTPTKESRLRVLFKESAVFDYWRVEDKEEIEFVWSVLSTVLAGLGAELKTENSRLSIQSTLALLEPRAGSREDTTLSFSFMTRKVSENIEEAKEGILIRWSRNLSSGALVSVSFLLSRRGESKSDRFEVLRLWIEPGFKNIPNLTFVMKKKTTWKYRSQEALVFDIKTEKGAGSVEENDAGLYVDATNATLWKAYTQSKYIGYEKMLGGCFHSEMGEPKLRDVELVFRRTQFPPRFDFRIKTLNRD